MDQFCSLSNNPKYKRSWTSYAMSSILQNAML